MKTLDLSIFERVTNEILEADCHAQGCNHLKFVQLPNRKKVEDMVDKLFQIVYPGYFRDRSIKFYNIRHFMTMLLEDVAYHVHQQVAIALRYRAEDDDPQELEQQADEVTMKFLQRIPDVKHMLDLDIEAFYEGDPAAENKDEIIFCYPGLRAITIYRFAHELLKAGVPVLPRIMTEYAHEQTGIDIHPGAEIGAYFFIDHGTGIVIGETTVIGNHVKIYQGVTLGGLSTRGGQSLRGQKRHPTIEDNVTIYSGASILGGKTVIGHDSVIGGNAFITKPVAPYTKVSVQNQELVYNRDRDGVEPVEFM